MSAEKHWNGACAIQTRDLTNANQKSAAQRHNQKGETMTHAKLTGGVQEIRDERNRQIGLGYTDDHDQQNAAGELLLCAMMILDDYLARSDQPRNSWPRERADRVAKKYAQSDQPLAIAGALIAAELDRLGLAYIKSMPHYGEEEHPKDYHGECACNTCLSYGD